MLVSSQDKYEDVSKEWLVTSRGPGGGVSSMTNMLYFSALRLATKAFSVSVSTAPTAKYNRGKPDDITVVLGLVNKQ